MTNRIFSQGKTEILHFKCNKDIYFMLFFNRCRINFNFKYILIYIKLKHIFKISLFFIFILLFPICTKKVELVTVTSSRNDNTMNMDGYSSGTPPEIKPLWKIPFYPLFIRIWWNNVIIPHFPRCNILIKFLIAKRIKFHQIAFTKFW